LTDVAVPNAQIVIQYLASDGINWYSTGITAITGVDGMYAVGFPFMASGGWVDGTAGVLRASFGTTYSNSVTVNMDAAPPPAEINLVPYVVLGGAGIIGIFLMR
jgi:hypothetical protein